MTAAFSVTGGQTLTVTVGAQGTSTAGGYGGGGAPGAGKTRDLAGNSSASDFTVQD